MIREIITNLGNFSKFNDIEIFMRVEKFEQIEILSVRLWNGDFLNKGLLGVLTYTDILSINN